MTSVVPGATYRPVRFEDAPGVMTGCRGWVLHVQVGLGSPWTYFNGLPVGGRKVSTGWVSKSGHIEQYQRRGLQPWAQGDGNQFYRAWETEGFPNEPLTPAQIESLARIHIWEGAADLVANAPGDRGIIVHSAGGRSWGGHACPGTIRAGQRAFIIARAQELRGKPVTPVKPKPTYAPPFPLPHGWYFGPESGPKWSVSGYHGHGDDLAVWQRQMAHRGWSITVDGRYGSQTARVAKSFQRQCGIDEDSFIGWVTWGKAWTQPVTDD